MCGIFPLDSFIRSFSYSMHSWYLLFSWHSNPLHMQYKRFCQLRQQTATHRFCLGRFPVSYCNISREEWRNQWSSLHWISKCTSINQLCCMSHSFCSTLAFSFGMGFRSHSRQTCWSKPFHFTMATTSCYICIKSVYFLQGC